MVKFIIGLFIGAFFGIFIMSLFHVSGRYNNQNQYENGEGQNETNEL